MKKQRKNTDAILKRVSLFSSNIGCNRIQCDIGMAVAKKTYNQGSSGAHAISSGIKASKKSRDAGISHILDNTFKS